MKFRLRFLKFKVILCCFVISSFSKAEDPYALNITHKDGLPSNTVFQVFQDTKGYIWIAHQDGLSRYDGFEFLNYSSPYQNSRAGSFITEDVKGRIWYENFDGHLFYVENNSLNYFSAAQTLGYVPFCVSEKYLFVLNFEGVQIFDIQSLKLVKSIKQPLNEIEHAVCINEDLFFISDNIFYKVNQQLELISNKFFVSKTIQSKKIVFYNNQLLVYSKHNANQELYYFDKNLNFFTTKVLPEPEFIQGGVVIGNQLWFTSSYGVFVYDLKSENVTQKKLFERNNISNVLQDAQGNFWISTLTKGIFLINNIDNSIYTFKDFSPTKILSYNNGILLSTQEGMLVSSSSNLTEFKTLLQDNEKVSISYTFFDSIHQQLFYASKGFSCYFLFNNKTKNYFNFAVKSLIRIDKKYFGIAVSGFYGLFLDPSADISLVSEWDAYFKQHKIPGFDNLAYFNQEVRAKSIDYNPENKSIVVATNGGLYIRTLESEKELQLNGASFYADKVFWNNGLIYALETKGNLYTIDENGAFTLLNTSLDRPYQEIKRVKKLGNELYIICNRSIYVYDLLSKTIRLIDFQITYATYLDIEKINDKLFVLTHEGLIQLATSETKNEHSLARFHINYIKVNDTKLIGQTNFNLAYYENNIQVNFSVIDFGKSFNSPIFYRLNKQEWITVNKDSRTLLFSSLSPDNYVLEFKVGDTFVDEKIYFEINPPYWQRWWFYLAFAILLLVIGSMYFRWRIVSDRKKIALLNEKIQLEQSLSKSILTAIKSQMNPHFFYNALNTIQAFIYTNDNKTANAYLAKFSKLTRTVLEMSEQDTVTLSEEFKALNLYLELEKMRFSKNFNYRLHTENIESPTMIEIPPMLIQPYIENAIKHGLLHREGERKLAVGFNLIEPNLLEVIIEDNGVGRKKSGELNQLKNEKHSSFSSHANQKRLEILNEHNRDNSAIEIIDQYDANGNALGTKVVLNIKTS
jgi:hypothetical protein